MSSREDIEQAVIAAHRAGDTQSAERLASMLDSKAAPKGAAPPQGAAGAPGGRPTKAGGDPVGFLLGNLNEGGAALLGSPTDAMANVVDLAKAAAGTVQGTVTGKPPSEMFDPMDRSEVFGSGKYLSDAMRKAGVINPTATDPTSPGGAIAAGALRAVPSILLGRNPKSMMTLAEGRAAPTAVIGPMMTGKEAAKAGGWAALSGGLAAGAGELGADPAAQQIAGMLPGMAHQGAAAGQEKIRKGIVGNADVPGNAAAAQRAGIANPDPAAVAESKGLAQLTSTFRRLPGGGGKLDEAEQQRTEGLKKRTGEVARDLGGPVGAEKAGGAIKEGAEGAISAFRSRQKQLYDKVAAVVPETYPVDVTRLARKLNEIGLPIPGAETLSAQITSPKISAMRAGLEADLAANANPPGPTRPALKAQAATSIPYKAAAELRSRIGEMFEGGSLPEGITQSQAKAIYRALTDDIKGSLPADGKRAWERASNYTRLGHGRIDDVYRPLLDKNTPEKALKAAFSGTKEGSSAFRKVMGSLTPTQRDAVAAHVIENMGKAGAGRQDAEGQAFSAETFLTNWNKLDPGARNALFTSPNVRRDIETIAQAISKTRTAYAGTANPSGTGKANTHAGFYGAGATGVIIPLLMGHTGVAAATAAGLGGELALNHTVSRALTSPEFVKWLAEGTKAPQADQARYSARLATIAHNTKDPETREALLTLSELSGQLGLTEGK